MLSHSGKRATTLLIIYDGSTIIHQPETTSSVPYSMTLIFRQSGFYTALCSAYLYSQYKKIYRKQFFVSFLTWMKSIFYASYHLYCIFRWSTPQISALGRVTTAPIVAEAEVGQKLVMTYQVRHRNTYVNKAVRIAILCLSHVSSCLLHGLLEG